MSHLIISTLVDLFKQLGYTWNVSSGYVVQPDSEDVEKVLEHAATLLASESVGARCEIGKLIVEKTETDFLVYVLAGRYR